MIFQYLHSGRTTPEHSSQSQLHHEPRLIGNGAPLSVLIVEDDLLVAGFLTDAIKDHGGRVIGVADIPSDAFGLVVEHRPDAVIVDIWLKDGHDGLRAAEAMRVLYGTPSFSAPDSVTTEPSNASGSSVEHHASSNRCSRTSWPTPS